MLMITLKDSIGSGDELDAFIDWSPQGISLSFEGYGENTAEDGHGQPIFIEFYGGELVVRAWSDINQEDPTHVINMEGARESLRKD